ncbi:hypothetical protein [Virgibacillus halodenitrificans]|uniref:Uncharacterized protein n=1 Tax=Virgibacillus halodenitrificans TaxID=1482 RepID=A0ABR7VQX9_VIRHA|nr:hypothetical protein [Virgibacillus halodenitrificans]MBD1223278.1 hypothetical protein [Virgibacillus halodenitrificans]
MEKFRVVFKFTNNEEKTFDVEKKSYSQVASEIMDSSDGWFGIAGDIINLRNVTTCKVYKIENGQFKEI